VAVLGSLRAYAAHPGLAAAKGHWLEDSAKNGGVVSVQYNQGIRL